MSFWCMSLSWPLTALSLWKGCFERIPLSVGCEIFLDEFWGWNGIYQFNFETWNMSYFEGKKGMNDNLDL